MSKLEELYKLFKSGDIDASLNSVEEILSNAPNNPDALHLGAMIFNAKGEIQNAHNYITKALQLSPQNYEMFNTLGNVFFQSKDIRRARISYQTAIDLNVSYEAALKNLASLEIEDSRPFVALDILKDAKKLSPQNTLYDYMIIRCLRQSEQIEAAYSYLEDMEVSKESDGYLYQKSQLLYELGKFDDAINVNSQLITSPDYSKNAIMAIAQIYHMTGQWDKCLAFFDDLKIKYGNNSNILLAIAHAYLKSDDTKKALETIELDEDNHKKNVEFISLKGQIALKESRFETAYQESLRALKLTPGNINLMSHLALAAIATKRHEEALTLAENALLKNPYDQFWIAIKATGGRLKGQDYKYYYNYSKFVKVYDLVPPIGFSSIGHFNIALKGALDRLHGFSNAPLDQTLRIGTQTSPNLIHLDIPIIRSFFEMINDPIRDYLKHIGQDIHHPLLKRNSGDYRLHSAWSVKLNKDGHHVNHVHPEGWISSSYYVDTPDISEDDPQKSGWIQFGTPPVNVPELPAELTIAPKVGRLVLFPSYIWHGTIPSKSEKARMTLPFDLIPA